MTASTFSHYRDASPHPAPARNLDAISRVGAATLRPPPALRRRVHRRSHPGPPFHRDRFVLTPAAAPPWRPWTLVSGLLARRRSPSAG